MNDLMIRSSKRWPVRKRRMVLILLAAALPVAWITGRSLVIWGLVSEGWREGEAIIKVRRIQWAERKHDDFIPEQWRKIKAEMTGSGVSPEEVAAVLQALRQNVPGVQLTVVPVYVRKASIALRPVWVFGVAWEWDTVSEPPCHIWSVVISAQPPYEVLGEDRCA
jgi:hypothetical protein